MDTISHAVFERKIKDELSVLIPVVASILSQSEKMVKQKLSEYRDQLMDLCATDAILRKLKFYRQLAEDRTNTATCNLESAKDKSVKSEDMSLEPVKALGTGEYEVTAPAESKEETYERLPAPCTEDVCPLHLPEITIIEGVISAELQNLIAMKYGRNDYGWSEAETFYCPIPDCLITICNSICASKTEFAAEILHHVGKHDLKVHGNELRFKEYFEQASAVGKPRAWDTMARQLNDKRQDLNVQLYWALKAGDFRFDTTPDKPKHIRTARTTRNTAIKNTLMQPVTLTKSPLFMQPVTLTHGPQRISVPSLRSIATPSPRPARTPSPKPAATLSFKTSIASQESTIPQPAASSTSTGTDFTHDQAHDDSDRSQSHSQSSKSSGLGSIKSIKLILRPESGRKQERINQRGTDTKQDALDHGPATLSSSQSNFCHYTEKSSTSPRNETAFFALATLRKKDNTPTELPHSTEHSDHEVEKGIRSNYLSQSRGVKPRRSSIDDARKRRIRENLRSEDQSEYSDDGIRWPRLNSIKRLRLDRPIRTSSPGDKEQDKSKLEWSGLIQDDSMDETESDSGNDSGSGNTKPGDHGRGRQRRRKRKAPGRRGRRRARAYEGESSSRTDSQTESESEDDGPRPTKIRVEAKDHPGWIGSESDKSEGPDHSASVSSDRSGSRSRSRSGSRDNSSSQSGSESHESSGSRRSSRTSGTSTGGESSRSSGSSGSSGGSDSEGSSSGGGGGGGRHDNGIRHDIRDIRSIRERGRSSRSDGHFEDANGRYAQGDVGRATEPRRRDPSPVTMKCMVCGRFELFFIIPIEAQGHKESRNQETNTLPAMTAATVHSSVANSATVSIAAYCSASILMTVTNKVVLSRFDFNMNFLLLAIQAATAVIMLWVFKKMDLISYRKLDKSEAKKWFPISLGLVAMIYTGSKSLQFLSIPVYTIFKNLTIILIAYGEVLWFGSKVTPMMLLSFAFMVLSSVIAGWSDISSFVPKDPSDLIRFNPGYGWMALNCLSSAGYVLYLRKRIKHFNFKDYDTVYYNNLLSFPVMLTLSICLEGWRSGELERTFAPEVRSALMTAIVLSGVSSFLISYGSAWCVRCTSSTTYSMVGALNKLPVAASGILFFGDPATFGNIFGILFGFIAGLLYSYSKTEQAQRNLSLANGSSLSNKPSATTTTNVDSDIVGVSTPATVHKSTALPLYKSNPNGKVAD
ncbi:GDP-mannose transporter into the lumen of the Golgi [Mortierella sp. GBA30]|nr:GDP-mannose transporter into the lumen of the Golgi [Mortierella sp. GBA30]